MGISLVCVQVFQSNSGLGRLSINSCVFCRCFLTLSCTLPVCVKLLLWLWYLIKTGSVLTSCYCGCCALRRESAGEGNSLVETEEGTEK